MVLFQKLKFCPVIKISKYFNLKISIFTKLLVYAEISSDNKRMIGKKKDVKPIKRYLSSKSSVSVQPNSKVRSNLPLNKYHSQSPVKRSPLRENVNQIPRHKPVVQPTLFTDTDSKGSDSDNDVQQRGDKKPNCSEDVPDANYDGSDDSSGMVQSDSESNLSELAEDIVVQVMSSEERSSVNTNQVLSQKENISPVNERNPKKLPKVYGTR